MPEGTTHEDAIALREDQAVLNITWRGRRGDLANGSLPDAVPRDLSDAEVLRIAEEAIRGGDVPGIPAEEGASLEGFVVDRIPVSDGAPVAKLMVRPKAEFGGEPTAARADTLPEAVAKLHSLLQDPAPGCSTWYEARDRAAKRVFEGLGAVLPGVMAGQGMAQEILDAFDGVVRSLGWDAIGGQRDNDLYTDVYLPLKRAAGR